MQLGHRFGHGGRLCVSDMSDHGYKLQDPIASSILQVTKNKSKQGT